jgi:hypothetical protein
MLAGEPCPGTATCKPKRGYKVDKKAGLGEDGGTTTLQGKDVPAVSITVRVWTQAQLEKLSTIISALFPSGAGVPDPVRVSHPVLAMLGITALFFESLDGPTQVEPGLWEVQFSATEFRQPKPVGSSTAKSARGISKAQRKAMRLAEADNAIGVAMKKFESPPEGSWLPSNPSKPKGGSWY